MNIHTSKAAFLIILTVLISVCASISMYWVMSFGPGVSPDSTIYMEAAEHFINGEGLFTRHGYLTHYPPVFPIILGTVSLITNGDILLAGRVLAAILFGANLLVVCLLIQMSTKYSVVATTCTVFLMFLFSGPVIEMHSYVWSEAPYLFFSMAGLLLLTLYIESPKPYLLVSTSILIGLAVTTRYVGLVLLPTIAIAILMLDQRSIRKRVNSAFFLVSLSSIPILFWILRNILIASSATNRSFSVHFFNFYHFKNLIKTVHSFFLPIPIPLLIEALHIATGILIFIFISAILYKKLVTRKNAFSINIITPSVFLIYLIIYFFFIVLSISFFDAHTPIDNRILLPAFFAIFITATNTFWSYSEISGQKYTWISFVLLITFLVSINAEKAINKAIDIRNNGKGYSSKVWRESETLTYLIKYIPQNVKIYSNASDVIFYYYKIESSLVPNKEFASTLKRNVDFKSQMNQVVNEVNDGIAVLVYFNKLKSRKYLPSKDEIVSAWNIPTQTNLQDGTIYGVLNINE